MRWFVLNVEANVEIDITAADGMRELARELADRCIHLGLARVKNDVYQPLERAEVVIDVIGKKKLGDISLGLSCRRLPSSGRVRAMDFTSVPDLRLKGVRIAACFD